MSLTSDKIRIASVNSKKIDLASEIPTISFSRLQCCHEGRRPTLYAVTRVSENIRENTRHTHRTWTQDRRGGLSPPRRTHWNSAPVEGKHSSLFSHVNIDVFFIVFFCLSCYLAGRIYLCVSAIVEYLHRTTYLRSDKLSTLSASTYGDELLVTVIILS